MIQLVEGSNEVKLEVGKRSWQIYGVVTDMQTHAVIPSVKVTMNGTEGITDGQGAYMVSGTLSAYQVVVTFSKEGYAPRQYTVTWTGEPYELNATLLLKEFAQATLYGTVTDKKGNPVTGATLSLFWNGNSTAELIRGIGSSYSIEAVSPGSWHITAVKDGYEVWDNMITVVGGEPNELNIVLTQLWNWEGIYQPEDYLTKWEDMVAVDGNLDGVIADIAAIPGITDNASTAGQNLYWSQKGCSIADFTAPNGRGQLIHYLGWEQKLRSLSQSTIEYIAHLPGVATHLAEAVGILTKYAAEMHPGDWYFTLVVGNYLLDSLIASYGISSAGDIATLKQDSAYLQQWVCVSGVWAGKGPCQETNAWNSVVANYLNFIAVYAECKRHGSTAPSYREFWDNLGTRAYRNQYNAVIGYIRYDNYGSGICWDVDYRADRWLNLYISGELLHYIT